MERKLPGLYFGLPSKREYPMAVIVSGKPKWDKRHAALAKGRAKQQYDRGFLTRNQYNQICKKADRVLRMKQARTIKANTKKRKNTTVRMDTTFDDPGWQKYKRSKIKKRIAKSKTNPKKYTKYNYQILIKSRHPATHSVKEKLFAIRATLASAKSAANEARKSQKKFAREYALPQSTNLGPIEVSIVHKTKGVAFEWIRDGKHWINTIANYKTKNTTIPTGSTIGGGYMHAMRGLREGDYSIQRRGKQANIQYVPVGYSGESGKELYETALVAGKKVNPRKKKKVVRRKKSTTTKGWFKFTLFSKSGKKLQIRVGQGSIAESKKVGQRYLGKKIKGRIVHRIVIDGPYKSTKPISK